MKQILSKYLKDKNKIETLFGEISDLKKIGEGANGLVYSGETDNKIPVAIKFLVTDDKKKLDRFKSEYINISMVKDELVNVANILHYETLNIKEGAEKSTYNYILMKKYCKSLKIKRKELPKIEFEDFKKLFSDLSESLSSLEKFGIIHRDLKPENILIDENGNYKIADFGIAHFDDSIFPIAGLTKEAERLANFEFYAPEQLKPSSHTSLATDIYSFGLILYWFVFGEITKGTGRKRLTEVFVETEAKYFDIIIDKCLRDEPKERYQIIEEMNNHLEEMKAPVPVEEKDPFDEMREFNLALRSVVPEFYLKGPYCTESAKEIETIIEKLEKINNKTLYFNTGILNNRIECLKKIDTGNFLLNEYEIKIIRIWGKLGDSLYDDILIIETDKIDPYMINGEPHIDVAKINDDIIVPFYETEGGYTRYNGSVVDNRNLKIEERITTNVAKHRYYFIGTFFNSITMSKNDVYLETIQKHNQLTPEIIKDFFMKIRKNINSKISWRL
ncbi:protein kinase domain-containing protein [Fusobacterium ulcerans]|uniref:protein kinase domain-containing protein n=1 Tax=Fusobacterium ulcerans TaxID=861 RepID=UPI00241FDD51|nr:protein kinase [Fusobacterium ulcerans]